MITVHKYSRYLFLLFLNVGVLSGKYYQFGRQKREADKQPNDDLEDSTTVNTEHCFQYELTPNDLKYKRSMMRSTTFSTKGSYVYEMKISHEIIQQKLTHANELIFEGILNGTYLYGLSLTVEDSFYEKAGNGYLNKGDYQTLINLDYVSVETDKIFILRQPAKIDGNSINTNYDDEKYLILTMQANILLDPEDIGSLDFYIYKKESDCEDINNVIRPPEMELMLTDMTETEHGIIGHPNLKIKWADNHINSYYFGHKDLSQIFQTKMCNAMGYRNGKRKWIKGQGKKPIKQILDFNDDCPDFFMQYFYGEDEKYAEMYKDILAENENDRDKMCYKVDKTHKQNGHLHIFTLLCTGKITKESSTSLQSCGKGKCLLGYHAKHGTCAPNICHCPNGKPAISNYDYLDQICGYTATVKKIPAMEKETEDPNNPEKDEKKNDGNGGDHKGENHSGEGEYINDDKKSEENDSELSAPEILNRKKRLAGGRTRGMDGKPLDKELPFQVFLYASMASTEPHCSSAFVNPRYVITAAHCCYEATEAIPKLYVTERHIPGDCKEHPKYVQPKPEDTTIATFDIALIEIEPTTRVGANNLDMSKTLRPICLTENSIEDYIDDVATLTGLDSNQNFATIELTVTDIAECLTKYDDEEIKKFKKQGIICARNNNWGSGQDCKATTKGDSGGPIMIKYKEYIEDKNKILDRWELIAWLNKQLVFL